MAESDRPRDQEPKMSNTNTYRVYFTLGTTTHGLRLQSSKVVQAETREAAIAGVPGGTGADLLSWDDEA